ncbi:glucokinase [Actinocatenispora thailandica]|uniref:Glucokinase n=1 Tax=Actinocatenispora thailandica TaxID=227318 RepID=A0A7R7DQA4_9ACTN|nr:ROK family protein [Actinocatenispora thailandica]BCJ35716.1 glucokinase [Actinocatenispora thailandica]
MTEVRQPGTGARPRRGGGDPPHDGGDRPPHGSGDGAPQDSSAGRLLGIDIGGTKIALAVSTMDGMVLATDVLPTGADEGAEAILTRLAAAGHRLLAGSGGSVVAVGAVGPGIVRPDGVALSPNISGWHRVRLADEIATRFGTARVAVDNDVKAAGLAELRHGALRGTDPGLFVSLGTGVAAAITVGGRVLVGAHGAAGEFGYDLRTPDEPRAAADGYSPLERAVGGRGVAERAAAVLGEPVTAGQLFARTDAAARQLAAEVLAELAMHVANLCIAIDPRRVAVGGGLTGIGAPLFDALRARLDAAVPFPPELVPARFRTDGALHGALALATDAHRS